jgi:hypothetical protein
VIRALPEKREAGRRSRVEPAPKICAHDQAAQVFSYTSFVSLKPFSLIPDSLGQAALCVLRRIAEATQ